MADIKQDTSVDEEVDFEFGNFNDDQAPTIEIELSGDDDSTKNAQPELSKTDSVVNQKSPDSNAAPRASPPRASPQTTTPAKSVVPNSGESDVAVEEETVSPTDTVVVPQKEGVATRDHNESQIEAEVCETFFAWMDCWNEGNLFGYLDSYWDSEETRYISEGLASSYPPAKGGVVITGRRDIDRVFTDVFVKMKKLQEKHKSKKGVAGFLTLRKLIVTPTGYENAIVFGENQLEVAGEKPTSRGGVFTIHVRKMDGKWKIVSEHHTALPRHH